MELVCAAKPLALLLSLRVIDLQGIGQYVTWKTTP
jgi:hypothetical protein